MKYAKKGDPEIQCIVLTGYGELYSAIEALRLGASDYLLKPCEIDELVIRINNCLKIRDLRKKIKLYETILPICAVCHKIRDDHGKEPGTGEWLGLETYLSSKTGVDLSHGYCPGCFEAARKELYSDCS